MWPKKDLALHELDETKLFVLNWIFNHTTCGIMAYVHKHASCITLVIIINADQEPPRLRFNPVESKSKVL